MPYAEELVTLLHNHGYCLGIITNGTASLAKHEDINKHFSFFVNSDVCGDIKPTVIPFRKVVVEERVNRRRCSWHPSRILPFASI